MDCPPAQSLRHYAIGDLEDALSEQIERHLAACPACETTLAEFDAAEDTLMRHLPLAAGDVTDASLEPPGWLERLRNGPPAESDAAAGASSDADDAPAPQAELSAYELLGVLGRGGMGIVYRARHRQLHREVALKVLSPRVMATPEARRRFEREIQILGGLQHPGIVMATDAGRAGRAAYLVMELIDGVDLSQLVRRGGPLTVGEACEAGRQMARALAAAHETDTVHRDVKPSNAMVDRQGRVKLLDFGLAHLGVLSTESLETSLGRLLGTLDYMAPEQAEGDRPVDARADLYGLGATLFYLLTGRPPHGAHHGRSLLDQLKALTAAEAPRVSTLRGDVPDDVDELIARLLSRDPDERPSSAEMVADALSAWAGGDMSTRAAELPASEEGTDVAYDDRQRARQSLLELLGADGNAAPPRSTEPPPRPARRRWAARWGVLTVAAAVIGAMLFGVTLMLQTPEGKLRIESEVDDVQVVLVDEQNKTRGLSIERGDNETRLRAGRYHIRLASDHDNLRIDRDVITLQRGEETVARIQRTPPVMMETAGPAPTADDAIADEPLYQGKPESQWQRLFESETAPAAKLAAAEALVTLASVRPPKQRIERILEIGEEIVRDGFGDDSLKYAFDFRPGGLRSVRWNLNDKAVYPAYLRFQENVSTQVRSTSPMILAGILPRAAREGDDPQTVFAVSLLRHSAERTISSDPSALQNLIQDLDIPLSGIDKSAICQLVRMRYLRYLYDDSEEPPSLEEQRPKMLDAFKQLAILLRDGPSDERTEQMKAEVLAIVPDVFSAIGDPKASAWPRDLRMALANMALDSIVHGNSRGMVPQFHHGRFPFSSDIDEDLKEIAPITFLFPDVWLSVANSYLEQHASPSYNSATRDVVKTLDWVLRLHCGELELHFDGDDWPVEKTASLLTDQLRAYYTDDPEDTTTATPHDLLPATPAMLLTQIVRITGEVPDFVRDGHPRPESVAKRLARLENVLGQTELEQAARDFDVFMGLLNEAPYKVINLCIRENHLPKRERFPLIVRGLGGHPTPAELLYATSDFGYDRHNWREPPVDPLLLLTVLADHAGLDEGQGARIASLFARSAPEVLLRGPLEKLLSGSMQARTHVRRLLGWMAAKAKSDDLIEAIRYLDPSLVPASDVERGT